MSKYSLFLKEYRRPDEKGEEPGMKKKKRVATVGERPKARDRNEEDEVLREDAEEEGYDDWLPPLR